MIFLFKLFFCWFFLSFFGNKCSHQSIHLPLTPWVSHKISFFIFLVNDLLVNLGCEKFNVNWIIRYIFPWFQKLPRWYTYIFLGEHYFHKVIWEWSGPHLHVWEDYVEISKIRVDISFAFFFLIHFFSILFFVYLFHSYNHTHGCTLFANYFSHSHSCTLKIFDHIFSFD